MAELNRPLQGDVSFNRPTSTPSVAVGIADIAGAFAAAHRRNTAPRPTQADKDNEALKPIADRLSQLSNSSGDKTKLDRAARGFIKESIRTNPGLRDEIVGLGESFGFTEAPIEATVEDVFVSQRNDWLTNTPEGLMAGVTTRVYHSNGTVNAAASEEALNVAFLEHNENLATLEKTNREMQQVQADAALWHEKSTVKYNEMIPKYQTKLQATIDGINRQAINDGVAPNDTEVVQTLNALKQSTLAQARADFNAAGLKPDALTDDMISEITAPIDGALGLIEANRAEIGNALTAMEKASELEMSKIFLGIFGSMGAAPSFKKSFLEIFAEDNIFGPQATRLVETMNEQVNLGGGDDSSAFLPDLPTDPTVARVTPTKVLENLKVEYKDLDPGELAKRIGASGDSLNNMSFGSAGTPEGREEIKRQVFYFTAASSLKEEKMEAGLLRRLLTGKSLQSISAVTQNKDQVGVETTAAIANFAGNQTRRNVAVLQSAVEASAGRVILTSSGTERTPEFLSVSVENGNAKLNIDRNVAQNILTSLDPRVSQMYVFKPVSEMTEEELLDTLQVVGAVSIPSINEAKKAIENLNIITRATQRIDDQVFQDQVDALGAFFPALEGGEGVTEVQGGEGSENFGAAQVFEVPDDVKGDTEFLQAVSNSAGRLNFDPSDLLRIIQFETGGTFDPAIKASTSSATGLIQFLESTAKELGTSTAQLKGMTRAQQMYYVRSTFLTNSKA